MTPGHRCDEAAKYRIAVVGGGKTLGWFGSLLMFYLGL